MRTARTTAVRKPETARAIVDGRAAATIVETAAPVWTEKPKSPVRNPPSVMRYRASSGSSAPVSARIAATWSAERPSAGSAKRAVTPSPGMTERRMKAAVKARRRTRTAWPSRRRT
ncbi:Uncharacterised protein [Mycobacteroides abscessus subsp. abscessus]|nr:Uncharacterised protein [Mycobacteroides abscessus subsp. abscessus]